MPQDALSRIADVLERLYALLEREIEKDEQRTAKLEHDAVRNGKDV